MARSADGEQIRIEIEPVWRFHREGKSMLVMLDFLNEIRATGKITRAAQRAQMSYRHCWNLIEKWAAFFGAPLVDREQGRGTRLTLLGEKLVWAGQRLQARLRPQLQNLAQELESEINEVLPRRADLVRIHASHGFAVSTLRELLAREQPQLGIDLRYVSNQNSLVSLARGACEIAGVHLPQGELRKKAAAAIKQWITAADHRIIGFVTREMGLMVRRGNPLGITGIEHLLDAGVRFVNRDPESGTRNLFERLLAQQGIEGKRIDGYERVEFTHAAVAAYVASGMADASFGVEAAARQFDLDFVRLLTEDYLFVCGKQIIEDPSVQRLLEVMRSEAFSAAIAQLPGYAAKDAGAVKGVSEALR
ncbi:MAG TPA: substrate-binding domain-containing protein [Steroidobacteraceae bacterium]|nr:substrate-binding domain-containing protein [Steroidobacteraceae bacterium]